MRHSNKFLTSILFACLFSATFPTIYEKSQCGSSFYIYDDKTRTLSTSIHIFSCETQCRKYYTQKVRSIIEPLKSALAKSVVTRTPSAQGREGARYGLRGPRLARERDARARRQGCERERGARGVRARTCGGGARARGPLFLLRRARVPPGIFRGAGDASAGRVRFCPARLIGEH